jgi:hypothetical protein
MVFYKLMRIILRQEKRLRLINARHLAERGRTSHPLRPRVVSGLCLLCIDCERFARLGIRALAPDLPGFGELATFPGPYMPTHYGNF